MSTSTIRLWFCAAAAVIGAAVADPLVETASNAGWFGRGNFTDHSTADVIPALMFGGFFLLMYLVLKVRAALAGFPRENLLHVSREALRPGVSRLIPAIFALQVGVLFAMETAEQFAVYGHGLGGSIWLGGPILVSLVVHAIVCAAVAFAVAAVVRALARTTLRVITFIRAFAGRSGAEHPPTRLPEIIARAQSQLVRCAIGERSPPPLTA